MNMKNTQIHNLNYLKDKRRELRNNSTSAEATLWKMLKNKKLKGRKFRRQHSIENFIVDFFCSSENLIIELDGAGHFNIGQANADHLRDESLRMKGFKIIRIENRLVFLQPEGVLELISTCFKDEGLGG